MERKKKIQCRRGHMAATFDVAGAVGAAHVAGYGAAWRRAAAWLVGDVGESCCQIQPLAATPLDCELQFRSSGEWEVLRQ